jgi:molybdate transport system ATP-binding protein
MADRALHVQLRARRAGAEFSVDVAFDAPPGVTILFGPSGAGKSTTLAAIAGLVRPEAGRVALGAEVWFDSATDVDRSVHQRGVALVFQSLALFPHMSAVENVAYGIERALPAAERRERAAAMLARMKVAHLGARRPATFSGGEAQRVALARAFAMRPRIVLLDEPFSALDHALRLQLASDVRGLVDEAELPLVHVTHHRNEARAMGDRMVLVERGRVVAIGSADELLPRGDDSLPPLRGK